MLEKLREDWKFPRISNLRVNELSSKIKPVVLNEENKLFYIEDVDPVRTAFTWDPTFTDEATDLEEIDKVYTLHSSYPGLFKPSMEEIFCFIQDREDIDDIVAVSVSFLEHHNSGSGNIGLTTIYKRKGA